MFLPSELIKFIILCCVIKVDAIEEKLNDKVIKILYRYEITDSDVNPTFEEDYTTIMSEYFRNKNRNNPEIRDYEIKIDIYKYTSANYSYLDTEQTGYMVFEGDMVKFMRKKKYDMMVIDDRILYNDLALMQTSLIEDFFWILNPSIELFIDFAEFYDRNEFYFHDKEVFNDALYKNKIYGLPYELDFDLIYYHNNDDLSNDLVEKMSSLTWNELWEALKKNSYPLTISLGDDDDLLNFVIEYASNHYTLNKEYDKNYFNIFYNDTAHEFFETFVNLILDISEGDVGNSLYLYQNDAFLNFINGDSSLLKTKASHYKVLNQLENVSASLPPKNIGALIEKYLVVNRKSDIPTEILSEVALQLTSKDFQIFRAENFGSIPTFDLTQKESDEDIQRYCQQHSQMCDYLEKLNRLNIKEFFKSRYSPSYYEIEYMLPPLLRNNIEYHDIDRIIYNFKNIKELKSTQILGYGIASWVVTIITALLAIQTIYEVYKYRDHPYLKVVSPKFCIAILVGCFMNIFKIVLRLPPYAIIKARLFFLYNTISFNLIYIPMFAVTFRVYRIYTSKSIVSKSLSNKYLAIAIIFLITIWCTYRAIVSFVDYMYYMTHGDINISRFPMYEYKFYDEDHLIYENYMYFIFIVLNLFISGTGKKARKFGSLSYSFIIFIYNIHEYVSEEALLFVRDDCFGGVFLFLSIYNCILNLVCIYLLVGCRVLFVKINPDLKVNNQTDLKEFIPLELTKIGFRFTKRKINYIISIKSTKDSTSNYTPNSMTSGTNTVNEKFTSNGNNSNMHPTGTFVSSDFKG
ncbi:hypothetical protein U3516DRAFT_657593 [Neocallimastix sp. 'constans']